MKKIRVKGTEIELFPNKDDYISLTDIAKYRNVENPSDIIRNWMRNRFTINFLGLWEKINNPRFKPLEFERFRNESGENYFVLRPQKWIERTDAVGIISKSGRYGGTYAHKDIAFEFASWISVEFKLFLIKEFQRLKEEEIKRKSLDWDLRRALTKINYDIHTDAVNLIPDKVSKEQENAIYSSEADILNVALFGMTAKEWKCKYNDKIRESSNVSQLICLSNLESLNSVLIREKLPQNKRLRKLNEVAISQMKILTKKQLEVQNGKTNDRSSNL